MKYLILPEFYMQRDEAYLLDILSAAEIAIHYIEQNYSYENFLNDIKCQDAVIRRLDKDSMGHC